MRDLWLKNRIWGRSGPLWAARLKSSISSKQKYDLGHVLGPGASKAKSAPKGYSGPSLYRTCVTEDTFYRPCALEGCDWNGHESGKWTAPTEASS